VRVYTPDEEERIHLQKQVRGWARSGLLRKEQGGAGGTLDAALRTDLKRTNDFLRFVLQLFTVIISASAIGLAFLTLKPKSNGGSAVLLLFAALGCAALVEWIIGSLRVYRYGVEEALTVVAVVTLAIAAGLTVGGDRAALTAGLLVGALASFAAYGRYGFVYALLAAIACAAALPFPQDLPQHVQRVLSVGILLISFAAARALRRQHEGTYLGDEYELAEAAAWIGAYLLLNLVVTDPGFFFGRAPTHDWFYWATYLATWLMPIAGLTLAIRNKERTFLTTNLALAIVTIATNKTYLGLTHHSWDPMLLGVLMMGTAIGVRRWLSSGLNGERSGFTPQRILVTDRELLQTVANVSAAFRTHPAPAPAPGQPPEFGGGRSGGGGATGGF